MIENRHGPIADGFAEREAATLMVHDQWQRAPWRRRTLGADNGYDYPQFVGLKRELDVTPHVTQNLARPCGSAIDVRTTRHDDSAMSQHARPRIEPVLGWLKTIAWIRKVRLSGFPKRGLALRLRERGVPPDAAAEAPADTGTTGAT